MLFVLFGFWLLLNGRWTTEIAVVGAVLSLLMYLFLCVFMDYSPRREARWLLRLPRALGYLCFLIGEIVKSAVQTIRLIWSPGLEAEPKLVSFQTALKTEAGKVILADSITMTPGTITVDIHGDRLLVHCLDESFSEGLENSGMERRILKLEGGRRHE